MVEKPSLVAPYFLESEDQIEIREGYSDSDDCPWGFKHQGIDFFPLNDLVPIRAVFQGTVTDVRYSPNEHSGNIQVNLTLNFNSIYSAQYAFEPMVRDQEIGKKQLEKMLVKKGTRVKSGDVLGYLVRPNSDAHIDFSLQKLFKSICPEEYFDTQSKKSILEIMNTDKMCF